MRTKFSFHYVFQLSKMVVFEVSYYRLGRNTNKYFTTRAAQFNRPKTDFNHCGQAQKELLNGYPIAYNFFKKWDAFHLLDLTEEQYNELWSDLNRLADKYNSILRLNDTSFNFSDIKALSKEKIK